MNKANCSCLLLAALLAGCGRPPAAPAPKPPDDAGAAPPRARAPAAAAAAEVFEESDPVKLTANAVKHFGIRVETAETRPLGASFTAPARVSMNLEAVAHVGAPVSGRVAELRARAGDAVAKDAPLLVIDSPELGEAQSDLLQKRTTVTVAAATLEIAKSGYERAKKLLDESQGIALIEVQKREADLRAAEGALVSAKAAVTAAENKLKLLGMSGEAVTRLDQTGVAPQYTVRSPLAGRVIERGVALGEYVRPERDALVVVADMTTLWVVIDVPQAHAADVAAGSKVRITLSGAQGTPVEGSVTYLAPSLSEATRTVSARVEIPGGGAALPGMFAQAEILMPPKGPPVLAVPESAVQMIDGKPNVFVPVKGVENAFVARRVSTGPAVGAYYPILAGLKAGEPFVAAGGFVLKADLGKGAVQEE